MTRKNRRRQSSLGHATDLSAINGEIRAGLVVRGRLHIRSQRPDMSDMAVDGLVLGGGQSRVLLKSREGFASLQKGLDLISYDGGFHDSGSHVGGANETRKVPSKADQITWKRATAPTLNDLIDALKPMLREEIL